LDVTFHNVRLFSPLLIFSLFFLCYYNFLLLTKIILEYLLSYSH